MPDCRASSTCLRYLFRKQKLMGVIINILLYSLKASIKDSKAMGLARRFLKDAGRKIIISAKGG